MDKEFAKVCLDLNLDNTPDFGIINSDGDRTGEFIDYIKENQNLSKPTRYTFIELVIASMNDSMINQTVDLELELKFKEYIIPKIDNESWYFQVDYWITIKNKEKYPVGYVIEKYSKSKKENTNLGK